jgi:Spy/CpxP family protein refolding chaperone
MTRYSGYSKIFLLTIAAIAVGLTLSHLPKFSLLAQTAESSPEKAAPAKADDREEASAPKAEEGEEPATSSLNRNLRGGVLQQLNLSAAQKQQLKSTRTQFQSQIRERNRSARAAQAELDALLGGTASETELNAKFQQVLQLRQEAQQLQFQSVLAMRKILTPTQRKTFAEAMVKRREMRRARKQNLKENGQKNIKESE